MPEKQIAELKKLILQNEKSLADLKKTVADLEQRHTASVQKHARKTVQTSKLPTAAGPS